MADDQTTINPIRETVKDNTFQSRFIEAGTKLLKETNQANVITYDEFLPFQRIFNIDKDLYKTDERGRGLNSYSVEINKLYTRWRHELGINHYEVTYVIQSREDPKVVAFIDRTFTRIASDATKGDSKRASIPNVVPRNATVTREDLMVDASFKDLVEANNTPEQIKRIQLLRMESAIITRNFTEKNLAPEKRAELVAEVNDQPDTSNDASTGVSLLDDD